MSLDFASKAHSLKDAIAVRRKEREAEHGLMVPTGIDYLDDRLRGGMLRKDFILVSARTGAGKTTLGQAVGRIAAQEGRRPFMIALEAYEGEVGDRMVFGELARLAWSKRHPYASGLSFRAWLDGQCREVERDYLDEAEAEVGKWAGRMKVLYRGDKFTSDDITRELLAEKQDVDFWVFDHVHYVDSDDPNENRALKEVTKALRDIVLVSGRPVLAIAHLRKPTVPKKQRLVVPALEELHGASDLTKIATGVVTLAPHEQDLGPNQAATLCRLDKERYDGAGDSYVGILGFDKNHQRYAAGYVLGRLTKGGTEVEVVGRDERRPFWAKRAHQWRNA
jgi:hypothetical protein